MMTSTTMDQELHLDGRAVTPSHDSGARLARALLSYLVALTAALLLLPFDFALPASYGFRFDTSPIGALVMFGLYVPYGFLTRRARTGRRGGHVAIIMLSAGMLALALETAQLFVPAANASVWHLVSAVAGAAIGAVVCERVHHDVRSTANAAQALLLQLPLMGLVYLLLPLLWASAAAAQDDPSRLALTLCVGMAGASILGSVARATRAFTPDRAWWVVPGVAAIWSALGMLPSVLVDWRLTIGVVAAVVVFASWRGRWSAPMFVERRYEARALLVASPFMALYFILAGVWPGHSFRSNPLLHLGMPTTEQGLAMALPLLEMGIAATIMGYMLAEFRGRNESSFRENGAGVVSWACAILLVTEAARSVFGYEGASLLRAALCVLAATYGAGLYHLQRAHVKVLARRLGQSSPHDQHSRSA